MLESKDLSAAVANRRTSEPGRARTWLRRIALLPVRYEARAPAALPAGRVCYVLETDRLLDRLVLEDLCLRERWPLPHSRAAGLFSVRSIRGWPFRRLVPSDVAELEPLIARDPTQGGDAPLWFVPIAIFWGRAPQRDSSWLSLLSSEDWGLGGRLRRALAVLVHGRAVLVKVGEPLAVEALAEPDGTRELLARKAGRLLRTFFNDERTLTVGPDLSHRRLLLDEILESPWVVAAIQREVRASGKNERRVRARARRYAGEIAADYSYPVVRLLDRVFTWLWNRLYEGVDVRHLETLTEIAPGSELVYVPCHRSHIDYLLLAYVIYRSGLAPPHIAAGVNLNLPIVGRVLRRGGAFFIRRSFHGKALYSAVFRSYFRLILARGFPVKYFIEGGRSRTGRLLQPKLGLLTMTIQSYVADRDRPVVFVPVYFGYEKLVEGQTFLGELSGQAKRKETLGGMVRSLRALRERFGAVQVSFGEPIPLARVLDETYGSWRTDPVDEQFRPEWLGAAADSLGVRIMTAINDAAVINPVNLVSLVLLSMPKQAIVEVELRAQLTLYIELAKRAPYAARSGVSALTADEMIGHCERMAWLSRRKHEFGDVLRMDERRAVLASYYRNNIVHLYALPALVAAGFVNRSELTAARLRTLVAELYPCLRGELFLRLGREQLEEATDAVIAAMTELGSLEVRAGVLVRPADGSPRAAQLRLCAEIVLPFIERYYLCISLLLAAGSGVLRVAELVRRCRAASEQLALVYSLNSPDLFQAELFDTWLSYLRGAALLGEDAEGALSYDEGVLTELAAALGFVLPAGLRQTLVNLAGAAAPPSSG
ncbi:MAG TPA: glycerol-3-phosphate 1-O-acyltransferase PlsB [Gammaproteobacteria bacterium]|nr:glycerol-3-phosphate 1-O-acyltransferase PlsB [Gammaproteobacteria bacterium]